MGTTIKKVTYVEEGSYGSLKEVNLYACYNRSCDIVTIYDQDGDYLFSYNDTLDNNMADAIHKLTYGNFDELENVSDKEFKNLKSSK